MLPVRVGGGARAAARRIHVQPSPARPCPLGLAHVHVESCTCTFTLPRLVALATSAQRKGPEKFRKRYVRVSHSDS